MKRAAALLCFLLAAAAPRALAGTALLWLPHAEEDLAPVLEVLERDTALKLTLALESQPSGAVLERLRALLAAGRVELALRAPEAPPLFLLYYPDDAASSWSGKSGRSRNNPYFFALRLMDAGKRLPLYAEYPPKGLASPPGGMAEGAQPALRSLGLAWAAGGPPASTDTARLLSGGGVVAAAFDLLSSTEPGSPGYRPTAGCASAPCFFVIDGSARPPAPAGAGLVDYWLPVAAPGMTVSELLASTAAAAADTLSLPPWTGGYDRWAASPRQAGALSALSGLRDTMTLYMNERPGEKKLAAVMQAYFSTGGGEQLAGLADPDEEARRMAESGFQDRAADVYRLMDKSLPRWIFDPLEKLSPEEDGAAAFASRREGSSLVLDNGAGTPKLPGAAPALPGGLDPAEERGLKSLSVSWDEDSVSFTFTTGAGPEKGVVEGASAELYIDINKRQRAGRTELLTAAAPRLYPEDAWEYSLRVDGEKAEFFTAARRRAVEELGAETKPGGRVTVRVPRRLLAGNPERWGYAALLFYGAAGSPPVLTDALCAENSGGYVHAARHGAK